MPVIIRCSRSSQGSRDFDGEETLEKAVAVLAKVYPSPIVLAWCGEPGHGIDDTDMLELWMATSNVVTLIDARRDDEEDGVVEVPHDGMVGDLLFDLTFFDPRSGEVEYQSMNARDLA